MTPGLSMVRPDNEGKLERKGRTGACTVEDRDGVHLPLPPSLWLKSSYPTA